MSEQTLPPARIIDPITGLMRAVPASIAPAASTDRAVPTAGAGPANATPAPTPTPETEFDRAEKRYAQARARLLALRNRAADGARKLDTRRKVILGGALIDLAGRDSAAAAMLNRLTRNLPREQDRKAFAGWTPGDGRIGTTAQNGAASDGRPSEAPRTA